MDTRDVDVVVVGAGIMGASAAWQLARGGAKVALLEQFDLEHVRGSSHGSSRIFRYAYDQPDYIHLAQAALPIWREAEEALGKELLWTTGGIDVGLAPYLSPVVRALQATDTPHEVLSRDQAERRFPWFRIADDWHVIYQPDAGVLYADACRLGLVQLARGAGAEVRDRTRVDRILPGDEDVVVECEGSRWRAGHVVVAAAGWSNRLLEPLGLGVPLKVTREHVAYFPCAGEQAPLPFIGHSGESSFDFYGLPNWRSGELKIGRHAVGPEVDPDTEPQIAAERSVELVDFVRTHLPGCTPEPDRVETCLYAATPDDDFVVDRAGRVVLGIGFGGHGFKFGAVIGRMLADLVRGDSVPFGTRFSRERFGALAASGRHGGS